MKTLGMFLAIITAVTLMAPALFAQGCPGHAAAAADAAPVSQDAAAPANTGDTKAVGATEATAKTVKLSCAVFQLPELTEEIAKDFSKAIGKEKGIVALKPEMEQKQMLVVFDDAVLPQETMQKVVTSNMDKAKFLKMTDVPKDIKTGCGACPSRSSCQKTTK